MALDVDFSDVGHPEIRIVFIFALSIILFLWILLLTELYARVLMNQVFYILIALSYALCIPIGIWASKYISIEYSAEIGLLSGILLSGIAYYFASLNKRSTLFYLACSLGMVTILLISESDLLKFSPLIVVMVFAILIGIVVLGRSVDWNSIDPFSATDKTVIRVVESDKDGIL